MMCRQTGLLAVVWLLAVWSACAGGVELQAGAAKAVITPELGGQELILVTGEPAAGVNRDIYARALTLFDGERRLAIVTYDLNCLDVATPILRERCRDELGLDVAYLVPLATHNHAAPIQIVPGNFAYGRWLAGRIFELIQEAISNEQGPARVEFGSGHGYFVKGVGNAPVDFEIQVLKVTRGDNVAAVFFNHPTHPLQASETKIGAGHPGYATEALEAALPGAVALYADACGGNQFTTQGMAGTPESVQALGERLAREVLAISEGPLQDVTGTIKSTFEVISLPLAKPMAREQAVKLAKHYPADIGLVPYPHKERESNWVRALVKHYEEGVPFPKQTTDWVCTDDAFLVSELEAPRAFPCRYEETIVSKIGPLVFVAMQGEVCAPIGMRIKDEFRCDTPILVGAYMGEHNLYIPTRELVRLNLYQARVIQIQYASPVGWAPTVEDKMVAGVVGMVRAICRAP